MTTQEPTNPSELFSPFLPTSTNIPEEPDRIRTYLQERFSNMTSVINNKKIGQYVQAVEQFSGETWFYKVPSTIRNGYQSICYIPSFVPQTITLSTMPTYPIVGVNPELIMTSIYGVASLPNSAVGAGDGDYFQFNGQGDARIQFTMSDTQIVITTDGARSNYSGFIIASYVRNGL